MKATLITLGAVFGVLFLGVCSAYGYVNSVRNEGIGRETQLSAQYTSNQNYLSSYISGFYEQVGVANLKSEKMDQILTDAVKGRYEDGGMNVGSSIFTAIVEAYPDISGLSIYDKMMDYISAGREGYRATQDKLSDQLGQYDNWRGQDAFRQWVVGSILGFPSDFLEARIGTTVYRGKEARDKMWQIVLTSDAKRAYETGEMEPLSPERKR